MNTTPPTGAIPTAANHDQPWPGLAAFEEGDFDFFKGRDAAISAITRLVLREDLTFLWGLSGLGKTSLLRAGLFPQLREADIFPVYVRLRYDASDPPLVQQCLEAMEQAAARWGYETPPRGETGTLWEYVRRHDHRFWNAKDRLVTPLLVFDQFEEIFTLGRFGASPQIAEFFADLSSAITGSATDARVADGEFLFRAGVFKVLLSFREDFAAQVAKCAPLVTAIGHRYYRLEALTFEDAVAVVREGGGHLIQRADPASHEAFCRSIVDNVAGITADTERASAIVDPALLSLYCSQLNDRRKKLEKDTIDATLLEGSAAATIIPDFYEACMTEVSEPSRAILEQYLVLHQSRTRDSVAEETLLRKGLKPAELDHLIGKRILRRDTTRQPRIEFTHDVLVGPAVTAYTRRELARQRAEEEKTRRAAEEQRLADERHRADHLQKQVDAEREQARRRRRRAQLFAGAAVVVLASLATWRAFHLNQEQMIRLLLQASQNQLTQDPELSAVFSSWAARAAGGHTPEIQSLAAASLNRALRAASTTEQQFNVNGYAVVFGSTGNFAAVVREDSGAVQVLRLDTPSAPPQTVAAAAGKAIFDVKFVAQDAELLVLNSDASVERVQLSAQPPARVEFKTRNGRATGEADGDGGLRKVKQWALTDSGRLIVASSIVEYPKQYYAPASTGVAPQGTVRYVLSVADASSGQWLEEMALPSSVTDVILGTRGSRYAVVEGEQVSVMEFGGRVVGRRAFASSEIVLNAEGSHVIAVPRADVSGESGRRVSVWDVGRGDVSQVALPGRDVIVSTAFSPDGAIFGVVQDPGVAQFWRVPSLVPVFSAPLSASAIRFSPDGRSVLTWDNLRDAQLSRLDGDSRAITMRGGQDGIVEVAFSPDSSRIAALTAGGMRLWTAQTATNQVDTVVETKERGLRVVAFSPAGDRLLIGGANKTLNVTLSDRSVQTVSVDGSVIAMAYSADGTRAAIATSSDSPDVVDWASRIVIRDNAASDGRSLDVRNGRVTSIVFADRDRLAYVVETSPFAGRIEIVDLQTGNVIRRECATSRVTGLSVDDRNRRFAFGTFRTSYDADMTLSRFAFQTADLDASANETSADCQAAPPLNTAAPVATPSLAATPPPLSAPSMPPPSMPPSSRPSPSIAAPPGPAPRMLPSADVSPSSSLTETLAPIGVISARASRALSTTGGREVNFWLTLDRAEPAVGLGETVRAIAITADGRRFATGGDNGVLKLFDAERLTDPLTLQLAGAQIEALQFSDDGARLAALDVNGRVTLYPLDLDALIEKAGPIAAHRRPLDSECAFLGGSCASDPTTLRSLLRRMLPMRAAR